MHRCSFESLYCAADREALFQRVDKRLFHRDLELQLNVRIVTRGDVELRICNMFPLICANQLNAKYDVYSECILVEKFINCTNIINCIYTLLYKLLTFIF